MKALMTGLVLVFVLTGITFSAEKTQKVEKITGEVVKVDAKAGSITIRAEKKEHAFKAEAKLLEGINAGDKVEVEVDGHNVKSIKKVESPAPAPSQPYPAPTTPK